ncbi:hypothetical protein BHAMNSH16_11535 [Brachyspira hampsonii]|uniref:Endonuclease GajA/Old nuclease/RecF-like AAA domain-containing protein n=2 Tax=Brachyspira hampsonii TaxID=1287055 RepID=A0AAC9TUQ9_9SPIR|nr:AAA family ATPase [Brachyspira hampsonii]ASJ22233.1 hypothetical protein BHAMNSH16_11535 [Brachyspira hampsonii]OEJ19067.1 hypothetical protein A9496_05160 [Brachyspira hampsonii]
MKLTINNFSKIKKADVNLKGITVICGENNTGKTTVGKILFSIFDSNKDKYIKIEEELLFEFQLIFLKNSIDITSHNRYLYNRIIERLDIILKEINYFKDIKNISINFIKNILKEIFDYNFYNFLETTSDNIETYDIIINNISNDIEKILKNPYNKIMQEVSKRYFNEIFKNQINNLHHRDIKASLELEIKNKKMNIEFKNNECIKFEEEFDIINNIYYIDNPFILDEINSTEHKYGLIAKKLITSLTKDYTENMYKNIFSAVKNNDIMKNLEELLKNITIGEIIKNNEIYYLKEDNIDIVFENLSAGLKSFIIIKMLLSNTSLKENDILILDEPEIHLHPKWQLIYAELIVLLNKYLNLIIVITSHSPYFVDAINRYSKFYKIDDKTNFYLSELEKDNKNTMIINVNENIDLIYKKMYEPIETLNNMKYDEDIE